MSGNGFEDEVRPDLPAQHPELQLSGDLCGALGGTRTPNLLIRSQMLYPIELRAQHGDSTAHLDLGEIRWLVPSPAGGSE